MCSDLILIMRSLQHVDPEKKLSWNKSCVLIRYEQIIAVTDSRQINYCAQQYCINDSISGIAISN